MEICCRLIWLTHEYVVARLRYGPHSGMPLKSCSPTPGMPCSGVITEVQLLLFCAKVGSSPNCADGGCWLTGSLIQVLAINYLVVPGLSQVVIRAVSKNTPIVGRRSFK